MKKHLLLLLLTLLPIVASADAVEIDGIYYNLITKVKEAEVTSNPNKYTGDVKIPASVKYNDVEYSVTSIGKTAFISCVGLTSISIPNSVTSIGENSFSVCKKLTSVNIPNSVVNIGAFAFGNCSMLTNVSIPNSVTSISEGVFYECSGLTDIIIPNSVKSIGREAFYDCTGLTTINIPNSVESIGYKAFSGCSKLTTINIGSEVRYIYHEAFGDCSELKDVYCYRVYAPVTESDAFYNSYIEYATLHVPKESINAYKAHDLWGNFKDIVSIEDGDTPEPPETQKCATPTISYTNGKLVFTCATDGAECVTNITDADIKTHYGNELSLTATYIISVYATKTGYDNSEMATATLCWIDSEPKETGITDGVANIPAKALLIQSDGGIIKVNGAADGERVSIYEADGRKTGTAISRNGTATIATTIQPGSIAIVKVGEKSVKVVMK